MQLGYMPYIFHPDPKNAMVIGFGMGATACSLMQPEIEEVDLAEICSGVIKAAPEFAKWTRNVIDEPKLHIYDEDGSGSSPVYLFHLTFKSKLTVISGITRRCAPRDPFACTLQGHKPAATCGSSPVFLFHLTFKSKLLMFSETEKPSLLQTPVYGLGVEDGIRTHDTWNHNPVL